MSGGPRGGPRLGSPARSTSGLAIPALLRLSCAQLSLADWQVSARPPPLSMASLHNAFHCTTYRLSLVPSVLYRGRRPALRLPPRQRHLRSRLSSPNLFPTSSSTCTLLLAIPPAKNRVGTGTCASQLLDTLASPARTSISATSISLTCTLNLALIRPSSYPPPTWRARRHRHPAHGHRPRLLRPPIMPSRAARPLLLRFHRKHLGHFLRHQACSLDL